MSITAVKKAPKRSAGRNGAGVSLTVVSDTDAMQVPAWVLDLASYREWIETEEVPEDLRVCFLDGVVWIDMSREQVFTHVDVKGEYSAVLRGLAKASRRGRFFTDGLLLTNIEANISCNPDGTYVLNKTFDSGRIQLVEGKQGGYVEIEGSPDMVLEIVSDSSVTKDTQPLRTAYWKAGITEYWLVDARGADIIFEIYRHSAKGYVATRKHDGWLKSNVFGKSFRLIQRQDERGNPEFSLEVK